MQLRHYAVFAKPEQMTKKYQNKISDTMMHFATF